MKWVNRIILGLVIVLLLLIVLLLFGIIFYNTDKKMEIGSLTDWISSLSTLGPFTIAYRKAPDWINQQSDKNSYQLMEDFSDILKELKKTSKQNTHLPIAEKIPKLDLFRYDMSRNEKQECSDNIKQFYALTKLHSDNRNELTTCSSKLSSCISNLDTHGFVMKEKVKPIFDAIKNELNELILRLESLTKIVNEINFYDYKKIIASETNLEK